MRSAEVAVGDRFRRRHQGQRLLPPAADTLPPPFPVDARGLHPLCAGELAPDQPPYIKRQLREKAPAHVSAPLALLICFDSGASRTCIARSLTCYQATCPLRHMPVWRSQLPPTSAHVACLEALPTTLLCSCNPDICRTPLRCYNQPRCKVFIGWENLHKVL